MSAREELAECAADIRNLTELLNGEDSPGGDADAYAHFGAALAAAWARARKVAKLYAEGFGTQATEADRAKALERKRAKVASIYADGVTAGVQSRSTIDIDNRARAYAIGAVKS